MNRRISFCVVGRTSSLFLAISFAVCVLFDLDFPQHQIYVAWQRLLPGFQWISLNSFLLGLVESYGYGWYFTLIWVPLYNVMVARLPA
jgi:hypothetical protein